MPHIQGHVGTGLLPAGQSVQPQFGLAGAEQALGAGLGGSTQALLTGAEIGRGDIQAGNLAAQQGLAQTGQQVGGLFDQGVGDIQSFVSPGQQAQQQQAAFSGALGPEAQAQAFASFQESPGQQFLRGRQERALTRNAAATGGLSGGNILTALQEQAVGNAAQQFQQNFQNLGQLAGQGLQAAGQVGGLRGQQAGIQAGLGSQGAGLQFGTGQALGGIATGTGQQIGQNILGTGQQIGSFRSQAGRDIAAQAGRTTSALSGSAAQQGAGISDITGQGATNLSALIQGAGQGSANDIQQLQALLANISQGQASQVGGLGTPQQVLPPSLLGQIGQVSSGVGGLLSAFPQQQKPVFDGII